MAGFHAAELSSSGLRRAIRQATVHSGTFHLILSSLHLTTVYQIRLLVWGHSPHHFLQTLSVLFSLSVLAGSLLSSLKLLLYPAAANHLTTVQLSSIISISISLSFPQPPALFLGFFVNGVNDATFGGVSADILLCCRERHGELFWSIEQMTGCLSSPAELARHS